MLLLQATATCNWWQAVKSSSLQLFGVHLLPLNAFMSSSTDSSDPRGLRWAEDCSSWALPSRAQTTQKGTSAQLSQKDPTAAWIQRIQLCLPSPAELP